MPKGNTRKTAAKSADKVAEEDLLGAIKIAVAPPLPPQEAPPDDADAPKGVRYEDRIVAFVDILGFKEIVYGSQTDENRLNQIYGALDIRNNELAKHFAAELKLERTPQQFDDRFHTFSDCIVMSVSTDPEELGLLVFMVFKICRQLLHAGFLSRGGIATGPLLHRAQVDGESDDETQSAMVFGPAFIDAYNLESNHADGARVILQTKVWKQLEKYKAENPASRLTEFFNSHVARADDGPAFVNLFADFPGNIFYPTDLDVDADIAAIKSRLCNALNETADKPHQFRKNAMLAKEFNLAVLTASSVPRYKHLKQHLISADALPCRQ